MSVQPDIAFLRWQALVFVRNFVDRGVRPRQVALGALRGALPGGVSQ